MDQLHSQKDAKKNLLHNRRLFFTAIVLSCGAFTFGYDASVIGGALATPTFIEKFGTQTSAGPALSARTISIIVATPTAGALVGALINSVCADRFGRKITMWIGCCFSLLGAAVQTGSDSVAMITVGRVFTSISVFVLVGMAICFQNELSPPALRGFLGGLAVISINTGAVLAAGVNWGIHSYPSSLAWRLPIGLQNIFPLIIASATLLLTESPTYYLIKGDDVRARESLCKVRQGYTDAEIDDEMDILRLQKDLRAAEKEVSWTQLFKGTDLRRTILATYAGVFITLSGLIYATNYATIFLSEVGLNTPYLLVFILNILTLVGAIVGGILVDIVGRRNLALCTYTVLLIIDCVIGGLGFANQTDRSAQKAIAGFALMFGFFVACGMNILTYLNTAEMPTARLRNKTNAYALLSNSLTSLTCTYVFPYISQPGAGDLGPKTYLIFAGCMVVCVVFTYFYFPEVKRRTPAEVDEMFQARLPARQFKRYVSQLPVEKISEMNNMADERHHESVSKFE